VLPLHHSAAASPDSFTLVTAFRTQRLEEDLPYYAAKQGITLAAPCHFRTENEGLLLLSNPSLQLQLQELSDIAIDKQFLRKEGNFLRQFFQTKPRRLEESSGIELILRLHRGSVLVRTAEQKVTVYAGQVRMETSDALFALSTSHFLGQRVRVTQGRVKVVNTDNSITWVEPGQCLHTGSEAKPILGPLDYSPANMALRQKLHLLEAKASPLNLIDSARLFSDVNGTAESHFNVPAQANETLLDPQNEALIEKLEAPDRQPQTSN
jgi:hypothetical protein